MSVEELKARFDAANSGGPAAPFVLDVREPHEYAIVNLGVPQIPVGSLPERIAEIPVPKDAEIVTQCKSGARSQRAALALQAAGFTNVKNLAGGILAWADRIDPTLPKY
jgi:adenylyltransferase/sulfurtransferase